jgi:hypothetical protein
MDGNTFLQLDGGFWFDQIETKKKIVDFSFFVSLDEQRKEQIRDESKDWDLLSFFLL